VFSTGEIRINWDLDNGGSQGRGAGGSGKEKEKLKKTDLAHI
jgi:hypothetical protein